MKHKKKEELPVFHTSFWNTVTPPYLEMDPSLHVFETTTLGASTKSFVTTSYPGAPISKEEWNTLVSKIEGIKEADIPTMAVHKEDDFKYKSTRYRVVCTDYKDLLQDRILKNLSIMKSRLMMECAPMLVRRIECKMTPKVKSNIILAFRRINRYGKKTPFVARFDEYGRRLEDEVRIETLEGMTINIVDPEDYGELYLEFTGVIEDILCESPIENPYKID